MRVISGKYRSRVLKEVELDTTRSTKDRVKESIFNSIQPYIYDSVVLDLFSGSGALGIEALSRGASSCMFNDQHIDAVKVIKANISNLDIDNGYVTHLDYMDFLLSTDTQFDVILLDPPYTLDVLDDVIKIISEKKLLKESGIIVCLYSKNNSINKENNDIIEYKKKTIGITNVSFMKWGE